MFTADNVLLASEILLISVFGLPFYAGSGFLVKVFHSKKNMKLPLHAALLSMTVNLLMSVSLMFFYGVHGLAWANVIAAVFQVLFLAWKTPELRLRHSISLKPLYLLPILFGSLVMCSSIQWTRNVIDIGSGKWSDFIYLLLLIPLGIFSYLVVLSIFRFPELAHAYNIFKERFKRGS